MDETLKALLSEALAAWSEQFDCDDDAADQHINAGDLLDWFADWRLRLRNALKQGG